MWKPKLAQIAIGLGATALVVAAMGADRSKDYLRKSDVPFEFAASQIVRYPENENSIGLLDTRSGAVYEFRGNVNNPSTQNTWQLRVQPVKEQNSGLLQIQTYDRLEPPAIPPGHRTAQALATRHSPTFLVDTVTGRT